MRGDLNLGGLDPAIAQRDFGASAAAGSAGFPVLSLPTFPKGKRGKPPDFTVSGDGASGREAVNQEATKP